MGAWREETSARRLAVVQYVFGLVEPAPDSTQLAELRPCSSRQDSLTQSALLRVGEGMVEVEQIWALRWVHW